MAAETIIIKADRYIGPNVIGNMYRAGDKVEKGYLVLDLEKWKLNWCSPNQDNIVFVLDPADENISKIVCAKKASSFSAFIKFSFIEINFVTPYDWNEKPCQSFEFRNFKDEAAALRLVEGFTNMMEFEAERKRVGDYLRGEIVRECKSSAYVDLLSLSTRYLDKIRFFLTRMVANSDALTAEDGVKFLSGAIREMIFKGELEGIIDQNKMQYVDRDFGVKEQRVINVQMDFNTLVAQLGNKGILLSSIQCPKCGAACSLPKVGSMLVCDHCGNLIQVTDIFDKFKGIIG
jgi:hypothetical protein